MMPSKKLYCIIVFLIVVSFDGRASEINDSLTTKTVKLEELIVKESLIRHNPHSDIYRITPELKQGLSSVYEILSRLPGITYNSVDNTISVRMNNNIAIEVNGNSVSSEYLAALPIENISQIEIIYLPAARYAEDGIRFVIDIKLKNDYNGHDLYLGNYMMVSPGFNSSNIVTNEQPKGQYIYSSDKLDITSGYGFATINWNYPINYSREYPGIAKIETDKYTTDNPNEHNSTISNAANLGINWQIKPNQSLSFLGSFQKDKGTKKTINEGMVRDYLLPTPIPFTDKVDNRSSIDNYAGAIYYKGLLSNGWSLYSSLAYNSLTDIILSSIVGLNEKRDYSYRNSKKYFCANLDIAYTYNDYLSLNFGYKGAWNRYLTENNNKSLTITKIEDIRNNGYIYIDWSPTDYFLLHAGSGLEIIRKTGLDNKRNWIKILPNILASWQPSEKVQLMGGYSSDVIYPSLFQISEAETFIDSWSVYTGNDQLSPARYHTFSLQGTFFDSLIFGAEYIKYSHSITDWYEKRIDSTFMKTFINATGQEFRALLSYDWAITQDLRWNNTLQWTWEEICGYSHSTHTNNLSINSTLEYFIQKIGLLSKVEYLREMQKTPLLQGWKQSGQDLWQISLKKQFLKNTLSVSLNYVPPLHVGIRTKQQSIIRTPFLTEHYSQDLHTYDNLLMLRIEWRFCKGRSKKRNIQQYEFEQEIKDDKGLL